MAGSMAYMGLDGPLSSLKPGRIHFGPIRANEPTSLAEPLLTVLSYPALLTIGGVWCTVLYSIVLYSTHITIIIASAF